jgi:hypothetical protein
MLARAERVRDIDPSKLYSELERDVSAASDGSKAGGALANLER